MHGGKFYSLLIVEYIFTKKFVRFNLLGIGTFVRSRVKGNVVRYEGSEQLGRIY